MLGIGWVDNRGDTLFCQNLNYPAECTRHFPENDSFFGDIKIEFRQFLKSITALISAEKWGEIFKKQNLKSLYY